MIVQPPFLKKGNTIGITCPAGYLEAKRAAACITTLQQWGLEVMVGKTLGSTSSNYFSGTDEQRRDELQAMLDDDSIHAILCGRGGYGVSRIIDQLNWKRFKQRPKWIIGFSDITLLHAHLYQKNKVASLHAPMAAAFKQSNHPGISAIQKILFGKASPVQCNPHPFNQPGTATGPLIGGNLALLAHTCGTASQPNTKGALLFIEDIGEYTYAIDRMMHQLLRSGMLSQLAGLIIGGFTDMKDTERPFGKTVYECIHELVQPYAYPICFGFPVSHGDDNLPLKHGVVHQLSVKATSVKLKEVTTQLP